MLAGGLGGNEMEPEMPICTRNRGTPEASSLTFGEDGFLRTNAHRRPDRDGMCASNGSGKISPGCRAS